ALPRVAPPQTHAPPRSRFSKRLPNRPGIASVGCNTMTMRTPIPAALCPRRQLLIIAAVLALAPAFSFAADKTHQLFDGKDLAGWRAPTGTWTVVKGVSLDPADP